VSGTEVRWNDGFGRTWINQCTILKLFSVLKSWWDALKEVPGANSQTWLSTAVVGSIRLLNLPALTAHPKVCSVHAGHADH
jgi:hypothetical protein